MTPRWQLRTTDPALAAGYREAGYWDERSLGRLIADAVGLQPDGQVRIWSEARPASAPIGEVFEQARRFAAWLGRAGIGSGDVVAFQLPNCLEAAVAFWGTALAGAVVAPIVHFYGEKEVGFILDQCRPRAFVAMDRRWQDHVAAIPDCHLRVVGEASGPDSFAVAVEQAPPLDAPIAADPADPALLAYTSGTTASPKGVIHTHRSIGAEMRQLLGSDVPDRRPLLTGAPVGHAMGMLGGLLLPLVSGRSIHLIDRWDPEAVLAAMRAADLRFGGGSTYFLTSLLEAPSFTDADLDHFRFAGLGGSTVPASLGHRVEARGMTLFRGYGSTEHLTVTHGRWDASAQARIETDGKAPEGVEIRIVDDDGVDLAHGTPGEVLTRGPDLFAGYTDPSLTATVVDDAGWYRTGDIGVLDDGGWLTIVDRKQDIVIRGGENVSAAEVEEAMLTMPAVAEVALVGAPDERLGEHGCAFVRLAGGTGSLELADVQQHLAQVGLAKQKWPEELLLVEDLPRTPSGKVKKVVLRERLRSRGATG
jgi:acyl-CoA synthetase